MHIDINIKEAARPLSIRERIVLRLMLLAVGFIIPATYPHQWKEAVAKILDEKE